MAPDQTIPIRSWPLILLRLIAMLGAVLVAAPLYYVARPFARHNPVPRWFLGTIARISGIRLSTCGTLPQRGSFLVANHVSWMDIPALGAVTGSAFVAHDGLAQIGPLRWLCSLNDTVFIARHDRRSVTRQVEQISTALGDSGVLTIFAEGTTTDGRTTLPFKSSLLSVFEGVEHTRKVPIHPVWLDYGPNPQEIAWVGAESGLHNALRILGRFKAVPLTAHVLPALEEAERQDRKRIALATRNAIEAARLREHPDLT